MEQQPAPSVLIVEDELYTRIGVAIALEEAGLQVLEAGDATEALAILKSEAGTLKVVFTDLQMPGEIDGLTLATAVSATWPHINVVVTSGMVVPRPDQMPRGGRFVAKPYRLEDIVDMIRELC